VRPLVADGSLSGGATVAHDGVRSLRDSPWALPLAFVLFFVHVRFRPKVTAGLVSVDVADLAVLWVVLVAVAAARRDGLAPVLRSRRLWLTLAAFLAFVLAACFYPLVDDPAYDWKRHLVTWGKLPEFALLGPAAAILLRRRGVLERLLLAAVGVAVCAGAVALVQFAGARILDSWPAGGRQPAFTGIDELGTIGGIALSIAFGGILTTGLVGRRLIKPAFAAGVVCVVFSGAVAAGIGAAAAAVAALVVAARRSELRRDAVVAIVAAIAVCALGIVALRGGSIAQFARYVGLAKKQQSTTSDVQSYSQRLLLLYIGIRVWEDHPLLGAGWSSIREQQVYGPQLPAAHREFPDQPPLAFPSPQHPWGIDNAYVELLAEVGAVGLLLFLVVLVTGLWTGFTAAMRAPPAAAGIAGLGLLWLAVVAGVWIGQGLTISAVTDTGWLSLGLIGFGTAARQRT